MWKNCAKGPALKRVVRCSAVSNLSSWTWGPPLSFQACHKSLVSCDSWRLPTQLSCVACQRRGRQEVSPGLLCAWHQKQREISLTPEQKRAGQQQKPHEYGPRKVFLYQAVLTRVATVAPPDCKEALDSLLQMEDAVVDLSLANFGPEYNTPKDGRV